MSPRSGSVGDAVFLFDADGTRCAGSRGADAALGDDPIRSVADLGARFRRADGMPLELELPGTRTALEPNGNGGVPIEITTELLDGGSHDDCAPALIVIVRPLAGADDPATLQRALGSVLAHELRTPMTTIFGGAQLVTSPSVSSATRDEAARAVEREARHLQRIVEDLVILVRARTEATGEAEPLMLQHVLPRIVDAERATRPDMAIELDVPAGLPAVLASADDVEHTVGNLVSHAILYSPPGARISLRAEHVDDTVEIHVADQGPARDEGAARDAFDLFHRSNRTAADTSGANLTLVATRRLVERMNGRIWATAGSTGGEVAFSLPVAPLED
ncbi:MAG: sensor histidine kinase [Chloroflexota bacterium]